MITRLESETAKQYRAICDYWRLGPGRSITALYKHYQEIESPPAKTYATLYKWSKLNKWDTRILVNIEAEQKLIEEAYIEEQIKNVKRRYLIIDNLYELAQEISVDIDDVSVNQVTGLNKTIFDMISNTFNLDAPQKIALTDPSGKQEYLKDDIAELLKLADAAKRRPE